MTGRPGDPSSPLEAKTLSTEDVPPDISHFKGRLRNICGDFAMRIAEDGTWFHEGSPIGRKELVRLFATVLKRDDQGDYWLATPVEAGRIQVDDVPFIAVEATFLDDSPSSDRQQTIRLRSNLDDEVTIDGDHPLRVVENPDTGEPRPYVHWRNGMDARLTRSVYYDLVNRGCQETVSGESFFGIWSAGLFFPLGKLPEEAK